MINQRAARLLRTLIASLLSSTIFVVACEPELCEDSEETPSAACQNAGMTLAAEGQCDQGSGVDCQRVSYCSGQLEALCQPMMVYCDPPLPEDICRSEGLREAYGADCELVECQEVSYTSPCGGDDVVLCREAEEEPCELTSNTFALCEERGLSLATEEECAELDCEAIEVEECGGIELVYCKTLEMTSDLTRESFIEAVAVAQCESLNDCCRSLELEMSQENCVDFFVARLAELPSFEVGQAMACLQEIEAAPRTCASFNAEFMSCSALSNNQGGAEGAQPGESCEDVDCASIDGADVYCDFDDNSETDELVCYAERRGAEGDTCSSTCTEESSSESSCWSDSIDRSDYDTANCFTNDGLRCLDNVCAPLGVEGDFCLEPTECSTGFYCRRGFCTPSPSEGEACLDNSCALGLYCEMTTQTCVVALANGEMCTEAASSTALCASGYCDTSGVCADANPAEEFSSLCEAFIE